MKARTIAGLTLLVQTLALAVWTVAQVGTLAGEIHDAIEPGASNYATTLVIAGGFALALVVATLTSFIVLIRDRLDLTLLIRLEFGVMGLVVVTTVATGFEVSLPELVAFFAAALVATLALRTRLA